VNKLQNIICITTRLLDVAKSVHQAVSLYMQITCRKFKRTYFGGFWPL